MATMPPDPAGAGPAMGAEAAAPAGQAKTVCIAMAADGTFSVYEEGDESMEAPPAMPVPGQPPAAEAPEPGAKPAASIDEALQLARTMLEGAPSEEMSVEQAFQGGFNGEQPKGPY